MEDFLVEGKLNPVINTTQKNFLKIFAAWIIFDDLAFTTGESDGINQFFVTSDTTVRNTLAQMYIEMYKLLKNELAIALSEDTWTTRAMTFTFAGTIGSWISSDWELIERVLDFHPIEDKEHEGEYAAIGLAKTLADLDVLEKMSPLNFPSDTSLTIFLMFTSFQLLSIMRRQITSLSARSPDC
ncbi:hypothetical protein DFH09DRAFT_952060 [Mycena vulgaris]|nr:hypothetical protein DFH09DRAFT_952060 [Mycena vulgaris]